ncbi:YnfA family protein [Priestia megaterium]|nr:YnfA family protein [Priestia megaterium]
MSKAIFIFLLAGVAEIGGGYLIWQWIREGASMWLGFMSGAALVLYGILITWQAFPKFGRVYAVYGGVFIIVSLLWWWVDKKNPAIYDWLSGLICLIGVVILWPRN